MKRIYIQTWLDLKPKSNPLTDGYYLRLSNKIKEAIGEEYINELSYHLEDEEIDTLCCFLASYLEDVVSEIGIWRTFVLEHEKLYGKKLPFFNTEIYYEDEINKQDLLVLIWYFVNSFQDGIFVSPYNPIILEISNKVMLVLDDAYEYAPENKILKDVYFIHEKEDDFYKIRNINGILLFKTWLFYPDTGVKNDILSREIIENNDVEDIQIFLNENIDTNIHGFYTSLLSFKANEWTAKRIGKKHPLYNDILNISPKIHGYFFYKKQNEKYIYFEHIASGKEFELLKSYFDDYISYTKPGTIAYLGIVRWKNAWVFSGITTQIKYDVSLIEEQKKDILALEEVNFLDYNSGTYKEIFEDQYQKFLKYNNGSPIAFLPDSEIEKFNRGFIDFYNSGKEKPNKTFTDKQDEIEIDENIKSGNDKTESGLVFFNKKSGIEIIFGVNSAFPTKENPFYDKDKSDEHVAYLLYSQDVSKELALYCIENYKNKLSYFNTKIGNKYFNDLDFIFRVFKKEEYHSKPKMSLI